MKYASLYATSKKDYHWNADSDTFREVAEKEWLRWHFENVKGFWFGIVGRNKINLFLAGRFPTKQVDDIGRSIVTYIILQPESEEEIHAIGQIAANLLKGTEEEMFFHWGNQVAQAQEKGEPIPPPYKIFKAQQKPATKIGRFQYKCTDMTARVIISESTEALMKQGKDFLIASIWYSPERFFKNTGTDLYWNAPIAIFSPLGNGKEIPKGPNIFLTLKKYIPHIVFLSAFLILSFVFIGLFLNMKHLKNTNIEQSEIIKELQETINQKDHQVQLLEKQIKEIQKSEDGLQN